MLCLGKNNKVWETKPLHLCPVSRLGPVTSTRKPKWVRHRNQTQPAQKQRVLFILFISRFFPVFFVFEIGQHWLRLCWFFALASAQQRKLWYEPRYLSQSKWQYRTISCLLGNQVLVSHLTEQTKKRSEHKCKQISSCFDALLFSLPNLPAHLPKPLL